METMRWGGEPRPYGQVCADDGTGTEEVGSSRARFGRVFAVWLDHPLIGVDEIAVLTALAMHADADGFCWPSQGTLANRLKRSRPWVVKVIGRLASDEVALVEKRRFMKAGRWHVGYRLAVPASVPTPSQAPVTAATERVTEVTHGVTTVTQTESLEHNNNPPPTGARAGSDEDGVATDRRGARGQSPSVVASDWVPSADDLAWAKARYPGMDAVRFTERYINVCRAKGYVYLDHGAAWRAWLDDDGRLRPSRTRERAPSPAPRPNGNLKAHNQSAADAAIQNILARRGVMEAQA
jgi:hypothetical protein